LKIYFAVQNSFKMSYNQIFAFEVSNNKQTFEKIKNVGIHANKTFAPSFTERRGIGYEMRHQASTGLDLRLAP
jgi:hypothetical protein